MGLQASKCLGPKLGLTYVVWFLRLVQGYVLANEYADADTAQVEAVQELVDLRELCQSRPSRQLPLQVCHPHCHHWHHIAASNQKLNDVP